MTHVYVRYSKRGGSGARTIDPAGLPALLETLCRNGHTAVATLGGPDGPWVGEVWVLDGRRVWSCDHDLLEPEEQDEEVAR